MLGEWAESKKEKRSKREGYFKVRITLKTV